MKCPKCNVECVTFNKPYQISEDRWCDFYYCEKCQLVYTVTRKCKLCGGEHVRVHRLRKGERLERGYFIAGSHSSTNNK